MWKIILCTVVGLVATERVTYHNHKVFRIAVTNQRQAELFNQMAKNDGFSIWKEPSVNRQADLMVAPHKLPEFYTMMAQFQIPYEVYVENVQALIEHAAPDRKSTRFDFENYHNLNEIYEDLDDLQKKYPNIVQTVTGGQSYEDRPIKGVKVSFNSTNNPGIFIEGGIHAREWIASATAMYILHNILESNDSDVRALAEGHDWYIFPVFNPDGYEYTWTDDRMWRKTRKPSSEDCVGSDANRNWGYEWNTGGASDDPCSEIYAGSAPFSEVETKTMSEFMSSIGDKFYMYIDFHSYSQLFMFPYGYTTDHIDNYDDHYDIATKAVEALSKRFGTIYQYGSIAETIYVGAGGSIDWVKGILNTSLLYAIELRDTGKYGFLLPPEQIIPTGEEMMDSLVALFKEANALGYPRNK